MKSQLSIRRNIRLEEELELAIIQACNMPPDASDSMKSRQFSKTVRRLCRESLSGSRTTDLDSDFERLETIRREIAQVGSNLNQLALAFNSSGRLNDSDLAGVHSDLQSQFGEMTDVLKKLKEKINYLDHNLHS